MYTNCRVHQYKRKFHIHFGSINCVFSKILKKSQITVSFSKTLKILSFVIWVSNESKFHIHFGSNNWVFSKILRKITNYGIFFENTQNLSFAIWVSNERKFHIHFRNIYCVFRKYSKISQNNVSFRKTFIISNFAIFEFVFVFYTE